MKNKVVVEQNAGTEYIDRNLDNPLVDALGGESVAKDLGSERFSKVVDKLRTATGIEDLEDRTVMLSLQYSLMSTLREVMSIEASHKEELTELAIKGAEMASGVDREWYNVEAILGDEQRIDINDVADAAQEIKIELNSESDLERLDRLKLETKKRHLINAIIQGTANKGHYIFQSPEIKGKLDAIDPKLVPSYNKIMAVNELLYFSADLFAAPKEAKVGLSKASSGDEKLNVTAESIIFPTLLHELIKGFEEAKGMHGQPQDPEDSKLVHDETDTLGNEHMGLNLGPEVVERIRMALPDDVFEPENKTLISFFQVELYRLPAEEFITLMRKVSSGGEREMKEASSSIEKLMVKARENHSRYEDSK